MFGQIELENFVGLMSMPQDYQSAWTGGMADLTGATYKPLVCYGKQQVHGTNYFFIAEQTFVSNPEVRRVVKLAINEFCGEYSLAGVKEI